MKVALAFPTAAFFLLTGCAVGPDYKRPSVPAPPSFRGAATSSDPASLGDRKWIEVFQDPILQRLVAEALANNRDLKIAAQRILAAAADGERDPIRLRERAVGAAFVVPLAS